MSHSCPDCGESIEFAEQEVRLRRGTCGSCHHEFTLVEGAALSAPARAVPVGESAEAGATEPPEGTPECADCGAPLAFRALSDGGLEARCDSCDTTAVYVVRAAREEGRAPRGPRGREPEGREPPRSRPCRQCGAPLRFTTNEEGSLVGECEACGNRFVLPPRSDSGGGGGRFGRGGGRPGGGGRFRSPREGSSWGRSSGGGARGGKYRGGSRYSSDDGDERRRRRRPRED